MIDEDVAQDLSARVSNMNLFRLSETDATDFAERSAFYQDEAVRTPILVKEDGHPKTVLMAYAEFVRLRERARQAYALSELPDEIAQSILHAEVPDGLRDQD